MTACCWVLAGEGGCSWAHFLWAVTGEHTQNRVVFSVGKIVAGSHGKMESINSCGHFALSPRQPELPLPDKFEFPAQVIGSQCFLSPGVFSQGHTLLLGFWGTMAKTPQGELRGLVLVL